MPSRASTFAVALALMMNRNEEGGVPRADMRCEPIDSPGRVHCEVEARVAAGDTISTGDVIIVQTPTFVTALRGRIGPHDATTRQAEVWRWALALAAREKGSGDVKARVRLVVCHMGTCMPEEAGVVGHVAVGAVNGNQALDEP